MEKLFDVEALLSPLAEIVDIEPYDKNGEYQLDEFDFWNIYNPDYMDISDNERLYIKNWRKQVKEQGELLKQYFETFSSKKDKIDYETFMAFFDMYSQAFDFSQTLSSVLQYCEDLSNNNSKELENKINDLNQDIIHLKENIAELEPFKEKCPELEKIILKHETTIEEKENKIGELKKDVEAADRIISRYRKNVEELNQYVTIPDCVKCAAALFDSINEKFPYEETARIKTQRYLNDNNYQPIKKSNTNFYLAADIANVMSKLFKVFKPDQYYREFEQISCDKNDLHRANTKKQRAKKF